MRIRSSERSARPREAFPGAGRCGLCGVYWVLRPRLQTGPSRPSTVSQSESSPWRGSVMLTPAPGVRSFAATAPLVPRAVTANRARPPTRRPAHRKLEELRMGWVSLVDAEAPEHG